MYFSTIKTRKIAVILNKLIKGDSKMILSEKVLKDKILGCFNGKNAGGALGAPFECKRGTFPVDYYTQKDIDNNPPANDDLDLQICWLNAIEVYGNKINPSILADYWMTYIVPVWSEYGIAKSNLRQGIRPPFSGKINNYFGRSNGAYIRSEIWACLAPGNPNLAVRYAYMDACVDHESDGVYGEMFFAALESAAFVESDKDKLVEIGLSYIPEDCILRSAILYAQNCYKTGLDFEDARIKIMTKFPGTFGVCFEKIKDADKQFPETNIGDDVVNTIALTILSWYYGEDDFGKTICLATYCGEDADCTAATVGAIMGIIAGNSNLPEKWIKPIGNKINIICMSSTYAGWLPKTTDEMAERIIKAIPKILDGKDYDIEGGLKVIAKEGESLYNDDKQLYYQNGGRDCGTYLFTANEILALKEYSIPEYFDLIKVVIELDKAPYVAEGEEIKLTIRVRDNGLLKMQQFVNVSVFTENGLTVVGSRNKSVPVHNSFGFEGVCEFTLKAESLVNFDNTVLIHFEIAGRHTNYTSQIKIFSK